MGGFIKAHRQLLNWEWYTNIPVKVLFLHLLLKANHKPDKWRGVEISIGELVTSYEHLAKETGLTLQQVRTSINKLKSTGEITYKSTRQYSLISINNWDKWQSNNTQINKQITNNQQTNNNKQEDRRSKELKKNILSLSHNIEITNKEREILKKYIQRQPKIGNVDAYLRTIIDNGDYKTILIKEKERLKRKEERIKLEEQKKLEEVQNREFQESKPIDFAAQRKKIKLFQNYKGK